MKRRGIASLWALVVLAVATTMTAAIVSELLAVRRSLAAHENRTQAERLAEAGLAIALSKLKADPDYRGETLALIAGGEVKIAITGVVTVEARFPVTAPRPVVVTRQAPRP